MYNKIKLPKIYVAKLYNLLHEFLFYLYKKTKL